MLLSSKFTDYTIRVIVTVGKLARKGDSYINDTIIYYYGMAKYLKFEVHYVFEGGLAMTTFDGRFALG